MWKCHNFKTYFAYFQKVENFPWVFSIRKMRLVFIIHLYSIKYKWLRFVIDQFKSPLMGILITMQQQWSWWRFVMGYLCRLQQRLFVVWGILIAYYGSTTAPYPPSSTGFQVLRQFAKIKNFYFSLNCNLTEITNNFDRPH